VGVAGDLVLTAFGVVVVLAGPLEMALAVLLGFWLLVPGGLIVPHAPHLLLVDRAVLYAFAVRLLARSGLPGEPPGSAYALTPIHAALALYLGVGYANGVLLAPRSASLHNDIDSWLFLLDIAILFVVVLAAARTLGPWRIVRAVAGVLTVAVVIGIVERITGHGWSNYFFEGLPANYLAPGVGALSTRTGGHRAQGAAQFALEYGWVLAMFLPMAIFYAVRVARRGVTRWRFGSLERASTWLSRLPMALPVGMVFAVVFSVSRSAEVALAGAVLLLFLLAFDRRLLGWVALAGTAAIVVVLVDSSLFTSAFSTRSDPASLRLDRLPILFSLVTHRPFTGLGFNGVSVDSGGLDNSFALTYGQTGVLGIVAWVAVVATSMWVTAKALRAPRHSEVRMLGAACLIGLVGVAVAAATYDLATAPQSSWALVILAAVGASTVERGRLPANPWARRWLPRLCYPLVGVGVGAALLTWAPTSASQTFNILTVAPWVEFDSASGVDTFQAAALTNTLCPAVTNVDTLAPGTSVTCQQGTNFYPLDFPTIAIVEVRGPTPAAVTAELRRSLGPIYQVLPIAGGGTETIQTGKPAWATTAPLWIGAVGAAAMFVIPPARPRRRKHRPQAEPFTPVA
jgi:hypothetical protein